jgi:hypothetical protein
MFLSVSISLLKHNLMYHISNSTLTDLKTNKIFTLLSGKNIGLLLPIGIGIALGPILIVGNDEV